MAQNSTQDCKPEEVWAAAPLSGAGCTGLHGGWVSTAPDGSLLESAVAVWDWPGTSHPLAAPKRVQSAKRGLFLALPTDPLALPNPQGPMHGVPRWAAGAAAVELRSGSWFRAGGPWSRSPSDLQPPACSHSGLSSECAHYSSPGAAAGPAVSAGWRRSEAGCCQIQLFDLMFQGQVLSGKFSPPPPTPLEK